MTSWLPLLLLGPWLVLLGWLYWLFPRSLPRSGGRRLFDIAALLLAAFATWYLARVGFQAFDGVEVDQVGRHSGAIWQHVLPILYAYGGFSAVLLPAVVLRQRIWRPS